MSIADLSRLGVTCRPIDQWPGEYSKARTRSPFSAKWEQTLKDLAAELRHLEAKGIVLMVAVEERDIVVDGTRPRAGARAAHPGVILAFGSKNGPMKFACDRFNSWEDNVRAVALGLHDLRRLDRYGITKKGEQYRGWKQLSGATVEPAMTVESAAEWLATMMRHLNSKMEPVATTFLSNINQYQASFREAAKKLHPDAGGSDEFFKRLMEVKRVLDQHHGVV